jgi:hypothetical protein
MNTQRNCLTVMPSKPAFLGVFVAVLSCAAAYAQPGPPSRPRPPEGIRPAQAEEPTPPGRGFGPRGRPGGPEFGRPADRPRPWNDLPEPERRQIEQFMEEHFPRLYVEQQRLKARDETRYTRRMTRIAPQMRQIMEAMRTDPQRGTLMVRERQIEFEIQQTIARFRSAKNDEGKRRNREHLDDLVGKAFDCQNERRQMEVRELESRLSELRSRLSESEKMRPALIRQRVTDMLEKPTPPPDAEKDDDREARPEEPQPEPD